MFFDDKLTLKPKDSIKLGDHLIFKLETTLNYDKPEILPYSSDKAEFIEGMGMLIIDGVDAGPAKIQLVQHNDLDSSIKYCVNILYEGNAEEYNYKYLANYTIGTVKKL